VFLLLFLCQLSYSLTLIDALDTLAVMGNYTEFRRVADLLTSTLDFDRDINVSVFETNIRGKSFYRIRGDS
jgi:mannosidase alpha-like ER degradation enhancer 2